MEPPKGGGQKEGGQEDQVTLYDWGLILKLVTSTDRLHPAGREGGMTGVKWRGG